MLASHLFGGGDWNNAVRSSSRSVRLCGIDLKMSIGGSRLFRLEDLNPNRMACFRSVPGVFRRRQRPRRIASLRLRASKDVTL